MDTPDDECLLAELQENRARKDLSGSERKAFAAEVGRLIGQLDSAGQLANGQDNWLIKMAKTSGTSFKTLQNWFAVFWLLPLLRWNMPGNPSVQHLLSLLV